MIMYLACICRSTLLVSTRLAHANANHGVISCSRLAGIYWASWVQNAGLSRDSASHLSVNNWLAEECLSHGKGRGSRESKLHHTTTSILSAHDICKPYWRKLHSWALVEWGNSRPWRERKNCNTSSIITEGEMERGVRVRETRKQIIFFRSSLTQSQANEELILVMFNCWRFWEIHHNLFWRILANNMVVTLGNTFGCGS